MAKKQEPIAVDIQNWIRREIRRRKWLKRFDEAKIPVGFDIKIQKKKAKLPVINHVIKRPCGIKVKPKYKKIYLDNLIPAVIQETIEMLKMDEKLIIVSKHKQDYGWNIILKPKPGISYSQVLEVKEFFETACSAETGTNMWIDMEWDKGRIKLDVLEDNLPHMIPFEFDPEPYFEEGMEIPIPIGYTRKGLLVVDLADIPHLLVAGLTKYGKTNFVRLVLHSILPYCYIAIIDLKRLSFSYLSDYCNIAKTQKQAIKALELLVIEMYRRLNILEKNGYEKVQELPDHRERMPYLVLFIDELAQLEDEGALKNIKRLAQLARNVGIHIIAATQRPSAKVLEGDAKSQFDGRITFRMSSAIDSRIVVEDGRAVKIPPIPGRALYRHGIDYYEVQTMYMTKEQLQETLAHIPKRRWWESELQAYRLPAR